MRRNTGLRLAIAAAGSVAAIAAVAPGAQASYFDTAHNSVCKGAGDIHGLGASTQRSVLLSGWGATLLAPDPGGPNASGFGYDAGADYALCQSYQVGGANSIDYRPTGSGSARAAVGGNGTATPRSFTSGSTFSDFAFFGTDDPLTDTQITNAETFTAARGSEGQLLTIPVAQVAAGIQVRLPDGCQVADSSKRNISRTAANLAFEVGSSRVDLQACKLEYSIVSPK